MSSPPAACTAACSRHEPGYLHLVDERQVVRVRADEVRLAVKQTEATRLEEKEQMEERSRGGADREAG